MLPEGIGAFWPVGTATGWRHAMCGMVGQLRRGESGPGGNSQVRDGKKGAYQRRHLEIAGAPGQD
jgi:hypothetical protein